MIPFSERDPVVDLVKARAALAEEAPLMNWDEFASKHAHHLPGRHAANGFIPVTVIALVILINAALLYLSMPMFVEKLNEASVSGEAVSALRGVVEIADVYTPIHFNTPNPALNADAENSHSLVASRAESFSRSRVSRNAPPSAALETEALSEKINQYFEQLKSDNPSLVAERYLRSLLKAKDSLDKAFNTHYDADIEFGVVKSGDKHYAEYLKPQDFVRLSREKKAVVLDLRKPEEFEQARLRQALSAEYDLRHLNQVSEQVPKSKAIFLYGSDLRECESAKAFFWKKGFQTVYILNEPFDPSLFRKGDIVTSTR